MTIETITVSPQARQYLIDLLGKQDDDSVVGVRMYINDAGTPRAETCIAYCRQSDIQPDTIKMQLDQLTMYVDGKSAPFLHDAEINYAEDQFGGQLTIKAPNSKVPQIHEDSSVEDHIHYVLSNEINPALAAHGGEVRLMEVVNGTHAILQFGGGCQGCGMVDVTLKDGVEKTLLEKVPGLKSVGDITDHSDRTHAYY